MVSVLITALVFSRDGIGLKGSKGLVYAEAFPRLPRESSLGPMGGLLPILESEQISSVDLAGEG